MLSPNQFGASPKSQKQDDALNPLSTILQSQEHLVAVLGPALKKKSLVGYDNNIDEYDS